MDSMAVELEERTLKYWHVSLCWNGKSDRIIETGSAIHLMTDTIYGLNPSRPLTRAAWGLRTEIIEDTPLRPNNSEPRNLLSFEELAERK